LIKTVFGIIGFSELIYRYAFFYKGAVFFFQELLNDSFHSFSTISEKFFDVSSVSKTCNHSIYYVRENLAEKESSTKSDG
jgi:hypothetical protein